MSDCYSIGVLDIYGFEIFKVSLLFLFCSLNRKWKRLNIDLFFTYKIFSKFKVQLN